MTSRLLVALLLCAADALHYLEGSAGSTEEVFANGTYSYAPQQYILYGIEYDHSAGFSGGNLTYGTGQSESSRILFFVLLDNPNLGVPPPGVLEY